MYPAARFNGSEGTPDLRVHLPWASGRFLRFGFEADQLVLTTISREGLVDISTGYVGVTTAINGLIDA